MMSEDVIQSLRLLMHRVGSWAVEPTLEHLARESRTNFPATTLAVPDEFFPLLHDRRDGLVIPYADLPNSVTVVGVLGEEPVAIPLRDASLSGVVPRPLL